VASGTVLTPELVERGYNLRAAVPDHPQWFERYAQTSAEARAEFSPRLDLRYGAGRKETLDLFLPAGSPAATFVFIHGGYWRALDKSDFSFVAPPFLARGIAVAVLNYDLCPEVGIATIVDECRRAIVWLAREGKTQGANGEHIVVGGHSAGGHLTAMLVATDWKVAGLERDPIVGGVSLSGVHDLTPMVLFSYNVDLRLDEQEAARLSPDRLHPRSSAPVLMAVGGEETGEFLRQTRLLWEAWPANRPAGDDAPFVVPGRNHFAVVADFGDPRSELIRRTLDLF
jgi:arylformamidase